MANISNLSHRHEAIMRYMIANPTARLGDIAAAFNISQPWLSCIIHSHAFKTRLREQQDALFGHLGATITEKLEAIAHQALDNIHEHISASNASPTFSLEVAEKTLASLGYSGRSAPSGSNNTQVNVFTISRDDLAAARQVVVGEAAQQQAITDAQSAEINNGVILNNAPAVPSAV